MIGFWACDYQGIAAAWYGDVADALARSRRLGHGARVVRCRDGLVMGVCIQRAGLSTNGILRRAERNNVRIQHGADAARRYDAAAGQAGEMWRAGEDDFSARATYAEHASRPVTAKGLEEFCSIVPDDTMPPAESFGRSAETHHPDLCYTCGWTAKDELLNFSWADVPAELSVATPCDIVGNI